ncbi:MAG: alanine racemase [Caldisericia bacterium]|jgi:alanine racemase|nr:alanine racemase [Caldisericia bacterium]
MSEENILLRPFWAEINLDALKKNYLFLRSVVKDKKLISVVKADAYGHGAPEIASELESLGSDYFAVATLEEGIELRIKGISKPILIFGYIFPKQVDYIINFSLTPTVYSIDFVKELDKICEITREKVNIHIKIDTGMGRVGILWNEAVDFIKEVFKYKNINVEGLYAHFSSADEKDKTFSRIQFERFMKVVDELEKEKIKIPLKHHGNSATVIDLPEYILDGVRCGISLYGLKPSQEVKNVKLYPVMSLHSKIIFLKKVPPNTPISYGRTFITKKESIIGTLPFGYADGYPRILSNKGVVLYKGKRVKVVGRVTMDQVMIDLSRFKDVKVGDDVIIMGKDGKEEISADDIAKKCNTINYEIVTRIGKRVPRVYIKNGEVVKIKTLLDR